MHFNSIITCQFQNNVLYTPQASFYPSWGFFIPYQPVSDLILSNFPYYFSNSIERPYEEINQILQSPKQSINLQASPAIIQPQNDQIKKIPSRRIFVKYAKKNAESNVINQIFSYLSIRAKSQRALSQLLHNNQELITFYYYVMRQIKQHNRKYINRIYLKNLLQLGQNHPVHEILNKSRKDSSLNVEKLRKILRILTTYCLKNICINTILTSSKLDKETKNQHLQRRTQIQGFINYHIRFSVGNM